MFGIGLPEMILILALALIVVGPDKLPELARSVAKGVLELKKTVSALKEDLSADNPFDSVKPELEEAAKSLKEKLGDPVAKEWQGILPDEGVNPIDAEDKSTVVEAELLSEKDRASLEEMDLAQPDDIPAEDDGLLDQLGKTAGTDDPDNPPTSPDNSSTPT